MGISLAYGPSDDEQDGIETIPRAHELGVTFFDLRRCRAPGSLQPEVFRGSVWRDITHWPVRGSRPPATGLRPQLPLHLPLMPRP